MMTRSKKIVVVYSMTDIKRIKIMKRGLYFVFVLDFDFILSVFLYFIILRFLAKSDDKANMRKAHKPDKITSYYPIFNGYHKTYITNHKI